MEVEQVGLLAQAWCFGSDGLEVGSGWWVMMPLGMLLFWGLIVGVAVWAFRQFTGRRGEDPLEIVRQRYARGEISREEYEQLRQDLGAGADAYQRSKY